MRYDKEHKSTNIEIELIRNEQNVNCGNNLSRNPMRAMLLVAQSVTLIRPPSENTSRLCTEQNSTRLSGTRGQQQPPVSKT